MADDSPRAAQRQPVGGQRPADARPGGLPAQLRSGIEALSGLAMDQVTVHYNSARPAQLRAHAFAQGSEIHLAPGQERHLPHEAWHVVQQVQGRVRPTVQMAGTAVNDDAGLEAEADSMGQRALRRGGDSPLAVPPVRASIHSGAAAQLQLAPSLAPRTRIALGGASAPTSTAEIVRPAGDGYVIRDTASGIESVVALDSAWWVMAPAPAAHAREAAMASAAVDADAFAIGETAAVPGSHAHAGSSSSSSSSSDTSSRAGSSPASKVAQHSLALYVAMFRQLEPEQLLKLRKDMLQSNDEQYETILQAQREAIEVLLADAAAQMPTNPAVELHRMGTRGTVSLAIFVPPGFRKVTDKLDPLCEELVSALLGQDFIRHVRHPLQLRLEFQPDRTNGFASTSREGNTVTVKLQTYQVTEFTLGELLGLISHELGVHSLDDSILSNDEMNNEEKDRAAAHSGMHGGVARQVGKNQALARQQDDHLTIGRGVLGQASALPRLEMYETTMIALLRGATPDVRTDIAAAYCLDVARILVTNDDPTEMMATASAKVSAARDIAKAAVSEWARIQQKYPGEEAVHETKVTKPGIFLRLLKLAKVMWSNT